MNEVCGPGTNGTTNAAIGNGSEFANTLTNESGGDGWFYDAARGLLGDVDTGLLLHYATGYPQSSCYRYVKKDPGKRVPPPEHMLRALIYPESGEPWLHAFMGGCNSQWWRRHKEALRLLAFMEAGGWKLMGLGNAGKNDGGGRAIKGNGRMDT